MCTQETERKREKQNANKIPWQKPAIAYQSTSSATNIDEPQLFFWVPLDRDYDCPFTVVTAERELISLWLATLEWRTKYTHPVPRTPSTKRFDQYLLIFIFIYFSLACSAWLTSSSSGFQLSPDFRQRASSNASSVGRLSPIPSVVDLEPSWSYASLTQDFDSTPNSIRCNNMNQSDSVCLNQSATLDQLAGTLADELTLQNEFLQG